MLFESWASLEDGGPALKQHCVNTPCLIAKWTRISDQLAYNTMPSKHYTQPNAGSTLVHRRRLWPSTIQHWTVLSVGGGVSTEYKLTPIQCMLTVRPASQVLDIFPGQWWACVA